MDIIFNDLVDSKEAIEICRDEIDEDYIRDAFCDVDIQGYIAKIDGQYAGFILFKKVNGYIYLDDGRMLTINADVAQLNRAQNF